MPKKLKEFDVEVVRVSYSTRTIRVSAGGVRSARSLAIDAAGDLEFKEHNADYEISAVTPIK